MKTRAGFVIAGMTAYIQATSFAAPTPPPSAATATPPTSGYERLTSTADSIGAYALDHKFVSDPYDRKHLAYWIRVSRFAKTGDEKSAYPTEYFLIKIDCPSQTYVIAARYEVDRDGKDIGPRPHLVADPVRKRLPGSEGGPYINFYNSPPELVAPEQLQPACFPGD